MGKQHDTEANLAERTASGDVTAFSALYLRHRDRVYSFAYRMVGVQGIAEEITQEAFLVLIEHPERYREERGSLLTFLCAIARNQIMYYLRRTGHGREVEGESIEEVEQPIDLKRDPLRELLDEELSNEVNSAIETLPALQREVIVLREFQDLSYEEIAIVTGVDINVVKVRLHRARQSLARKLGPYLVSSGDYCYELR